MKREFFLFLFAFSVFISQSQPTTKIVNGDTINVTDAKNLKQEDYNRKNIS